ncbi:hypothetical protein Vafri_21179, partial [Volvox africanus]
GPAVGSAAASPPPPPPAPPGPGPGPAPQPQPPPQGPQQQSCQRQQPPPPQLIMLDATSGLTGSPVAAVPLQLQGPQPQGPQPLEGVSGVSGATEAAATLIPAIAQHGLAIPLPLPAELATSMRGPALGPSTQVTL